MNCIGLRVIGKLDSLYIPWLTIFSWISDWCCSISYDIKYTRRNLTSLIFLPLYKWYTCNASHICILYWSWGYDLLFPIIPILICIYRNEHSNNLWVGLISIRMVKMIELDILKISIWLYQIRLQIKGITIS